MRRSVRILVRLVLGGCLVGGAVVAVERHVAHTLPAGDEAASGLVVDGAPVQNGELVDAVVSDRVRARLEQRVELVDGERVLFDGTLEDLGAVVDEAALRSAVERVGRRGDVFSRLDQAEQARAGHLAVAMSWRLPLEPLARALEGLKADRDEPSVPARWDFEHDAPTDHRDGLLADLDAAVAAVERAARGCVPCDPRVPIRVALPFHRLAPAATREALARIDRSALVSRHETVFAFGGGQAGRAQNVARAAAAIDGTVLMPGEVVSFNRVVGPRSLDNGFAEAGEIYRGEMRKGVGGGTCQVAGTLYAAAYLGGLEVVQRSPHSRPIGYLPPGLDATVAYPHVDLKLRNDFAFPVVIHSIVDRGHLSFELLGRERPAAVEYGSETVRVTSYKRKVTESASLPPGKIVKKKKGIRGLVIKKVRRIALATGERVEETTDVYPPNDEEYLVPPGTDADADLPPLPGHEGNEGATPAATADTTGLYRD